MLDINKEKKYLGYCTTPIGLLEITATADYVLSAMFVEAKRTENSVIKALDIAIKEFEEYFAGTRKSFDFPMYLNGTEFQKKEWKELLKIPYGEVLTYRDIAVRLGNEKAVRAVGNANGKNKLCIAVPCHRLIGTNGSLTGYAGGLYRKQWLIEHERKFK